MGIKSGAKLRVCSAFVIKRGVGMGGEANYLTAADSRFITFHLKAIYRCAQVLIQISLRNSVAFQINGSP